MRLYADKCGHFKEGDLGVGGSTKMAEPQVFCGLDLVAGKSTTVPQRTTSYFPSPYLSLCLELSLAAEVSSPGSQ